MSSSSSKATAAPRSARSASSSATKTEPRLSASLILVNSKHEVLVIQRTKESSSFPGMHAFPGGNYDRLHDGNFSPEETMPTTAIRETFEETGILLAATNSPGAAIPGPSQISSARKAVHSRSDPLTFPDFLKQYHLSTEDARSKLIPFTQWITPANVKVRFWTWFYVAFLDEMNGNIHIAEELPKSVLEGGSTGASEADTAQKTLIPSHDGQIEVISTYFQHPRALLDAFDRQEISLMPPQFYLLATLSYLLDIASAERENNRGGVNLSQRIRELVTPAFGGRVFNPRHGGKIRCADGVVRLSLMYEDDQDYEKEPGADILDIGSLDPSHRRWHRSLITFKDGRVATIKLERDIEVLKPDVRSGSQFEPKL